MNKYSLITITFYIALSCLVMSCKEQPDFSDPKSVIEKYYKYKSKLDIENEYELIADTCKSFLTLQDYRNYYLYRDTIKPFRLAKIDIIQLPIDPSNVKYRLFEIQYILIDKMKNDSTKHVEYTTVLNKTGSWKIIWTKNLLESAWKLIESQKIEESLEVFDEILKYDPLNGNAFNKIGWAKYEEGKYEEAIISAKRAIELNPKDALNYNLLASIYSAQNKNEVAIENYKKGIEISLSEKGKGYLLSNLSLTFLDLGEFYEAKESVAKALLIDSSFTHSWYTKGQIYENEKKIDSAIFCYQKATTLEAMENSLQSQLYYQLANSEFNKASSIELNKNDINTLLIDAKKQIIKALVIMPEETRYKKLLDDINKKIKSKS